MSKNLSVRGAKPKAVLTTVEDLRRRNGRFLPYPFGTRLISSLDASKMLDGGEHRIALFSCSGSKSGSRHTQTLTVHTA